MITSDALFSTRESTLKANFEIYVAEILKTKEKKFMRDKLSYDNSQAYNCAPTKNRRCNIKMRTSRDLNLMILTLLLFPLHRHHNRELQNIF